MWVTIIVLALSIIFFVSGKVRSDLVALCALLALLIFQILTPEEGLSGFSNSTVVMMVGLFIVGGGIFQTGLAKMISSKILKLAGKSELRLFLLVVLTTAGIGAFVSNTGTVALMLPIVVSMAAIAGANPSRLLMPLAFASSMGGMMTLIGTPPNLIISDTLADAGYDRLSFFSFLPVGLICVTVGTLVLLPLSKWFLDKRRKSDDASSGSKSLNQLVNEYGLSLNLFRVRVTRESGIAGRTMGSLNLRSGYGLNILEIRRQDSSVQNRFMRTVKQYSAPDTVLEDGDVLYLSGLQEQVRRFAADFGLSVMDDRSTEENKHDGASLDFYDIGIAEVLLMSSSRMNNHTVKEADFREKFNVNVLGIRRKHEYHAEGDEPVADDFEQIGSACGRIVDVLHEHNHREDRLVGIHARNHRQQRRDEEHRHGAVNPSAEQQAAHADGHRGAERCRRDVQPRLHEAEAERVADGREQCDDGERPHRRVGNGPEPDGGNRREETVRQDIE